VRGDLKSIFGQQKRRQKGKGGGWEGRGRKETWTPRVTLALLDFYKAASEAETHIPSSSLALQQ